MQSMKSLVNEGKKSRLWGVGGIYVWSLVFVYIVYETVIQLGEDYFDI